MRSQNYSTKICFLTDDFQYIERVHSIEKSFTTIDVFPCDWFLFISDMPRGSLQLLTPAGPRVFDPPVAVFIPPYTMARWRLSPGTLKWSAFRSRQPLPSNFGSQIQVFAWPDGLQFCSAQEVLELIQTSREKILTLASEWTPSELARAAKAILDQKFSENISIASLSTQLATKATNLSHVFSRCYGLSPLRYRNNLRLHQSLRLLSWERRNITQSCYESGFEDFSRFFRQFKGAFGAKPSAFRLNFLE